MSPSSHQKTVLKHDANILNWVHLFIYCLFVSFLANSPPGILAKVTCRRHLPLFGLRLLMVLPAFYLAATANLLASGALASECPSTACTVVSLIVFILVWLHLFKNNLLQQGPAFYDQSPTTGTFECINTASLTPLQTILPRRLLQARHFCNGTVLSRRHVSCGCKWKAH